MADVIVDAEADNANGLRSFSLLPSLDSSFDKVEQWSGSHEEKVISRTAGNRLFSFTLGLADTYKRCNSSFKSIEVLPQRILTNPAEVAMNGCDNQDANLICRVHDKLIAHNEHVYTILDLLGTGTFGQVFRCKREDTKQLFAVKVIKNKPAYHTQGMLEIKIAKLLNGQYDPSNEKHIVRLQESFEYLGHICVVFELLSMSLLDLLTQNQFRGLPLSVVQRFTKQILTALMVLEDANIIHCDLKPENVLLMPAAQKGLQKRKPSPPGNSSSSTPAVDVAEPEAKKTSGISDIKMIDFGSACFEGRTVYSYIQSRFYRSPEVLVGAPYTGAIDMWSLACVCAEMFLGLPLFPGVSQHNQLSRIVEMFGVPPDFLIESKHGLKYFTPVTPPPVVPSPDLAPPPPTSPGSGPKTLLSTNGAKYRIKTADEYAAETNTEAPVLKKYLRYSQLDDVIMKCPMPQKSRMTAEQKNMEMLRRRSFLDFLQGLFRLNPFDRWTAKQASQHPFILNQPFTGPYMPKADLKVQERKLMFMVQLQRPNFQDDTKHIGLKGLRTPTNFGTSTSGAQPNFTPLQYAHRRLSEPSDAIAATVASMSSKPLDPSSERPMLKRGDPVHGRHKDSPPLNRPSDIKIDSAAGSPRDKSLTSSPAMQGSPSDSQRGRPPILAASADEGTLASMMAGSSGRSSKSSNSSSGKHRPRQSFNSQNQNWVRTATENSSAQAQQQAFMQQQRAQQQQQVHSMPPMMQGWQHHPPQQQPPYPMPFPPHPAQMPMPPPWPFPGMPPMVPNMNMITQAMPFYAPVDGNGNPISPGATFPPPVGSVEAYYGAGAGSYGASSYGMFPGTSSSIQEGGSVVMTDFGMALLRPDMDEQRLLLSQNPGMLPPGYWRPMPGSFMPFNSEQAHAQAAMMNNVNSMNEAAARYNYAMQQNLYAYGGGSMNNVQMARSYDSKVSLRASNAKQQTDHAHGQPGRGQQRVGNQRRRSGGSMGGQPTDSPGRSVDSVEASLPRHGSSIEPETARSSLQTDVSAMTDAAAASAAATAGIAAFAVRDSLASRETSGEQSITQPASESDIEMSPAPPRGKTRRQSSADGTDALADWDPFFESSD